MLASQTGLKVSDFALMLELNKRTSQVAKLREVIFLSPYRYWPCPKALSYSLPLFQVLSCPTPSLPLPRMQSAGLSHRLALWFLTNCPHLSLLRDVCR